MSNTYLTSQLITPDAVAMFEASCTFIPTAYKKYDGMFTAKTYAPGDTINVRLDNFFIGQRGDSVTAEDIVEASIPLTIAPLYSVPIAYTPTDLSRKIVDFSQEFLMPAVRRVRSMMNADIALNVLSQVNFWQGDTTAPINSYASMDSVRPLMTNLAMDPAYKRYAVISPDDAHSLRSSSSLQNSFLPSLNKEITLESRMGRLAGMEILEEEQVIRFYGGTKTIQTPATDFQIQAYTASTITIKNCVVGEQTLKQGDLIYLPATYSFNQATRQSTGRPMAFAVTQTPAVADGSGYTTVSIYPNMILSGPRQNMSGTPAVNDIVSAVPDHMANVCYTERGLVCAIPPLERMDSPESYTYTSPKSGISMRISKTAEVLNNKNILRLDAQMATTWVPQQNIRKVSQVNQIGS